MKQLSELPQKDGLHTEYLCGLELFGGWATRIKLYEGFINTKMGVYILSLESKIN